MNMKCRFEHDGDCCNSGATQYMCKCKKPCNTIIPLNNADRIRAMSDEELADIMSMHTATGACNDWGIPHKKCGGNCRECIIDWLKQPAEGE